MSATVWLFKSQDYLKRLVNGVQNAIFSNACTNCQGARVQSAHSARKICVELDTRQLLGNTFAIYLFLKGMWQCDSCDKHLPKFVIRIINKSAYCCQKLKKKHCDHPVGFFQNKSREKASTPSAKHFNFGASLDKTNPCPLYGDETASEVHITCLPL